MIGVLTASRLISRFGLAVVAVLYALYVAYFLQLTSLPLQDYPNHVARAVVLGDLIFHSGARFGQAFSFHLAAAPYLLTDLLLTACVELFGAKAGAGIFTSLVLLSLPGALLFYMWANQLAPRGRLLVALIGLYLTTETFFLLGFFGFRLALALVIVSLALADLLRRAWSPALYAVYASALVLGYLYHLTALVFFAATLIVSGLTRLWFHSTTWRREIHLLVPVAALLALHFGTVAVGSHAASAHKYGYDWGDPAQKLHDFSSWFARLGGSPAFVMLLALAACMLWPVRRELASGALKKPAVVEQLLLAATFLGIFLVLPSEYSDAAHVDVRAIPLIVVFLMFACLHMSAEPDGRPFESLPVLGLALALALVNLGYLVEHLSRSNAWIARYRQILASIPAGAYVLPVDTQPGVWGTTHAGSFVLLDRGALTPYLFSADRGDPMSYFRYRHRPYTPSESWYRVQKQWSSATENSYEVQGRRYTWRFTYSDKSNEWDMADLAPVSWDLIACQYDYLLLMRPFDASLIGVSTRPVASNDAAALLAVDKQPCRPNTGHSEVRLPREGQ
jgi:hypothetical protein